MTKQQKSDIILNSRNELELSYYEEKFCSMCNGSCNTCLVQFTINSLHQIFDTRSEQNAK